MPRALDDFIPEQSQWDTFIFDDTDVTYNYSGWIPRGEVVAATSLTAAKALAVAYIERTTKVAPYETQRASVQYAHIWDNRAALTYF